MKHLTAFESIYNRNNNNNSNDNNKNNDNNNINHKQQCHHQQQNHLFSKAVNLNPKGYFDIVAGREKPHM